MVFSRNTNYLFPNNYHTSVYNGFLIWRVVFPAFCTIQVGNITVYETITRQQFKSTFILFIYNIIGYQLPSARQSHGKRLRSLCCIVKKQILYVEYKFNWSCDMSVLFVLFLLFYFFDWGDSVWLFCVSVCVNVVAQTSFLF